MNTLEEAIKSNFITFYSILSNQNRSEINFSAIPMLAVVSATVNNKNLEHHHIDRLGDFLHVCIQHRKLETVIRFIKFLFEPIFEKYQITTIMEKTNDIISIRSIEVNKK